MTLTPEQLRDSAAYTEALIVQRGLLHVTVDATGHMNQLRAHAAALEELAAIKADYKACRAHAERAEAALAECRTKLEVDPRTKYDGIDCRDETIRMLEQKCERLKFHAEAMYGALIAFGIDGGNLEEYRAEFKEE